MVRRHARSGPQQLRANELAQVVAAELQAGANDVHRKTPGALPKGIAFHGPALCKRQASVLVRNRGVLR
jgi:hypothetical protein